MKEYFEYYSVNCKNNINYNYYFNIKIEWNYNFCNIWNYKILLTFLKY